MNNLTISDYISFFKELDLNHKVKFLRELTIELNNHVDNKMSPPNKNENDEVLIDELFGIWKDEDDLTEETIMNRTLPTRDINLD